MSKRLFTGIVVFLSCIIVGLIIVLSIELLKDDSDNSSTTIADGHTEYVPTVTPVPAPVHVQVNPEDIPEDTIWIEPEPLESYDTSDFGGDLDFNKIEYCKHEIVNSESCYEWATDASAGDFFFASTLSKFYDTYAKANGECESVEYKLPDEVGVDIYFGNAGFYILDIDGKNIMFIFGSDQDYVYFDEVDNLIEVITK